MREMTQALANQGRYGDSVMVHMNPAEVEGMGILSGQPLTINPTTGAYEAFNWLGTLGGIAGGAIAGPWGAGIGAGLGTKIGGGSWEDSLTSGLMSGIMSWGMGSFANSDMGSSMFEWMGDAGIGSVAGESAAGGFSAGDMAWGAGAEAGHTVGTTAAEGMFGGALSGINAPAALGAGAAGLFSADQTQQNLLPTGAYGGNSNPEYQNEQFPGANVRTGLTLAERSTPAYLANRARGVEQPQFQGGFPRVQRNRNTAVAAQGGIVRGFADGSGYATAADAEEAQAQAEAETAAAVAATAGLGAMGPAGSFAPGTNTAQSIGNAISAVGSPVGTLTSAGLNAAFGPAEGFAESLGRGAISTGVGKGVSALTGVSNPMGMGLGILGDAISAYGDMTAAETAQDTLSMTDAITDMEGYDAGRGVQADPNDPNIGVLGHIGLGIANAFGGRGHDAMAADALSEAQQAAVAAEQAEQEATGLQIAAFNLANPVQGQTLGNQADQDAYASEAAGVGSSPDGDPEGTEEDQGPFSDPNDPNAGFALGEGVFSHGKAGMAVNTENVTHNPNIAMSPTDLAAALATNDQVALGAGQGVAAVNAAGNLSPAAPDYGAPDDPDEDENDPDMGLGSVAAALGQTTEEAIADTDEAADAEAAAEAAAANAAAEAVAAGMGDPSDEGGGGEGDGGAGFGSLGGATDMGDDSEAEGQGVEGGFGDDGDDMLAAGGLIRGHANNPQGATVDQGQDPILIGAVAAIKGQHPEPQKAVQAFIQVYGPEKFAALRQRVIADASASQRQQSGIAGLVSGPGDGLSDDVPGNIEGREPVNLADGEVIIPSDVVSGLGNGSTDAGAEILAAMNDRVRKDRTGTKNQPGPVDVAKALPDLDAPDFEDEDYIDYMHKVMAGRGA